MLKPNGLLRRRRLRCELLLRRLRRFVFATMNTPPDPADCLLLGLRRLLRRRGPDPDGLTTRILMFVSLIYSVVWWVAERFIFR
jgi:hypothetical protein